MAGIVDTNLLIYAANVDSREHSAALEFLCAAEASGQTWYLTEGIVYEFLRVVTHPSVFSRPLEWREGLAFLRSFLDSPRFEVLQSSERHWQSLAKLLEALTEPVGNLFFDIRTAVLMREHGIREIYTTDTDFLQFPEIRVVNPLRA